MFNVDTVPAMNSDRLSEISGPLVAAIHQLMMKNQLKWGQDLAILITTDAVHCGDEDWQTADAIAHIRGGQEMGRMWYEDGKLMKKINTFYDFVACGEFLVRAKFTSREQLYA
jgi:thiamine monophosphate synthase